MTARNRPARLSKTFVDKKSIPGRYGDGHGGRGLSLRVRLRTNGTISKTWVQRIKINGQVTNLGLGSYPVVTLDEARKKAIDNLRRVAQGEDIRIPPAKPPTTGEFLQQEADARARRRQGEGARSESDRMMKYSESISAIPVSEVTRGDILKIIEPLWKDKNRTARAVRGFLSAAMKRAILEGHRTDDPAGPGITHGLGSPPPRVHHRSLDHRKLGAALATIRDSTYWWSEKYALIFLALTGVRRGDVRQATWDQIDLESEFPIWRIPKTKNSLEHVVPLSTQAVEILLYAEERTGGGQGLVFPPRRGKGRMDAGRLSIIMKDLEIPATPHGFRASCRNWAGRRPDVPDPVAEKILAHTPPNDTVAPYLTDDYLEEREPLMQEWADYLAETMGPVISPMDQQQR